MEGAQGAEEEAADESASESEDEADYESQRQLDLQLALADCASTMRTDLKEIRDTEETPEYTRAHRSALIRTRRVAYEDTCNELNDADFREHEDHVVAQAAKAKVKKEKYKLDLC
jgi:hypothetical protein